LKNIYRQLKDFEPNVISGWLYHPSLLATFFSLFLKKPPLVVWHIRSLPFSSLLRTPGRYIVQRVLALLSHVTDPLIASNSGEAIRQHVALGFSATAKWQKIIPNGVELSEYFPDRYEGLDVRDQLGIPADAILVGCVGRFVPEKGYPVLFEALKIACEKLRPELSERIHFLGVGNGVSLVNSKFMKLASDSLEIDKLFLLDRRADVPSLLRTLDLFVLPSISEAFPNSLVEAMATGLACITTDVGQCKDVIAIPKCVVPPSDSIQLADRIMNLVEMSESERFALGVANRQRVASQYELSKMVRSFDELFYGAVKQQ